MSRAYTEEELKDKILHHFAHLVDYWSDESIVVENTKDRLSGLMHSVLAFLGGRTLESCALDFIASPHPEDKEYYISNADNYFENGTRAELDSDDWYPFLNKHGYRKKLINKEEK